MFSSQGWAFYYIEYSTEQSTSEAEKLLYYICQKKSVLMMELNL